MATVVIISGRTITAGTLNFGPAVILTAISTIQVSVDTVNMIDPAMSWSLPVEISFDGGATWQPLATAGRAGQAVPPNDPSTGLPATSAGFKFMLPPGTARQLRGSFTWVGPSMVMGDMTLTTN